MRTSVIGNRPRFLIYLPGRFLGFAPFLAGRFRPVDLLDRTLREVPTLLDFDFLPTDFLLGFFETVFDDDLFFFF